MRQKYHIILFLGLILSSVFWLTFAHAALRSQTLHEVLLVETNEQKEIVLQHLDLLWRGTISRNPTLVMAMKKISDKVQSMQKKGRSKKDKSKTDLSDSGPNSQNKALVSSSAMQNMMNIGGMGAAALVGSSMPLVGSSMLSGLGANLVDDTLHQVTPTDMVLLAREIERVQIQMMQHYLSYRRAILSDRQCQQFLNQLQKRTLESAEFGTVKTEMIQTWIIDRTLICQQTYQQNLQSRQVLVLMAGKEAVEALDKLLLIPPQSSSVPTVPESMTGTP